MWNTKKSVAAIFSAMTLTLASIGNAIPVFAEEADTTTSAVAATDNSVSNMELGEEDMQKLVDEIQHNKAAMENSDNETDNTGHDYYADENYDTDGNATLIKQEKIIYDSEEMQFIAVTTKDGDVFYILINYSAEGDEDNVFFLNKVDDFDLYSLLYAGNEEEEEKDPVEQAKKYADAANGGVTAEVSDRAEEATGEKESAEEKSTTKQPSSMNSNALILIGGGVLAVIGGAVLVLKKGKFGKKKNTGAEDFEEDYDDDYGSVTDEDNEA